MTLALHHIVEQAKCVALLADQLLKALAERDAVRTELDAVRTERDEACAERDAASRRASCERTDRYKALAELDIARAERDEARAERDEARAERDEAECDHALVALKRLFHMPQSATAEDIYHRCSTLNSQVDSALEGLKYYQRLQEKLKQAFRCPENTDDETLLKVAGTAAAIAREQLT